MKLLEHAFECVLLFGEGRVAEDAYQVTARAHGGEGRVQSVACVDEALCAALASREMGRFPDMTNAPSHRDIKVGV